MNIFKNKTALIVIILFIVAFVAYALMRGQSNSASGVKKQVVSTNAVNTAGGSAVQQGLDGPGKEFVAQLLAIQNINFALDLFSDPVYQGLQDWSREIQQQEVGRPNPFAPLGDESRISSPSTAEQAVSNISAPAVKQTVKKKK